MNLMQLIERCAQINGKSLATIDGTGHWPHAERPQAFFEVLSGFIVRSGRPGGTVTRATSRALWSPGRIKWLVR